MNKGEVENLIALLGRITQAGYENVRQDWLQALEDVTGERFDIDIDNVVPAETIQEHLGIPVKAGALNMNFEEIGKLKHNQFAEAIKEFKTKLFLLRAVVNEKDIQIETDEKGDVTYTPVGDKKYWFGTRGSERVWLDMDVYLP